MRKMSDVVNGAFTEDRLDLAIRIGVAYLTDLQNSTPHPDTIFQSQDPGKLELLRINCERYKDFIRDIPTSIVVALLPTPMSIFFSAAYDELNMEVCAC